jgi:hypothetical protein
MKIDATMDVTLCETKIKPPEIVFSPELDAM